jgi:hypothetical protein
MPFWITPTTSDFIKQHSPERAEPFCVSGLSYPNAAAFAASECPEGFRIDHLPYAANPQRGPRVEFMALCYRPETCAGNRSCPRSPCCSE